jgi:hypothetical protein
VPAGELRTEASRVIHSSGRAMTYADIAKVAKAPAELPKVDKSMLKPMAQFRLIGKDIPRVDVPAKSSGQAKYGIDQRLPGMLWASVLRAPVQGEVPQSVDDAAARAVAGVKNVVRLPYGVAVVADSFYTAKVARDKLKVVWSQNAKARTQYTDQMRVEYTKRAEDLNDKGVAFIAHGDAAKQLAGDMPIPQGATVRPQESLVMGSGNRWMGRISLTVPGEPQTVFAYFRDGLPGSGWALTSSSYSKLSLLTFSKGDRVATVQLQVSNFGVNEVTITVTPAVVPSGRPAAATP